MPGRDPPASSAAAALATLRAQVAACDDKARRLNGKLAAAKRGESQLPQAASEWVGGCAEMSLLILRNLAASMAPRGKGQGPRRKYSWEG